MPVDASSSAPASLQEPLSKNPRSRLQRPTIPNMGSSGGCPRDGHGPVSSAPRQHCTAFLRGRAVCVCVARRWRARRREPRWRVRVCVREIYELEKGGKPIIELRAAYHSHYCVEESHEMQDTPTSSPGKPESETSTPAAHGGPSGLGKR